MTQKMSRFFCRLFFFSLESNLCVEQKTSNCPQHRTERYIAYENDQESPRISQFTRISFYYFNSLPCGEWIPFLLKSFLYSKRERETSDIMGCKRLSVSLIFFPPRVRNFVYISVHPLPTPSFLLRHWIGPY